MGNSGRPKGVSLATWHAAGHRPIVGLRCRLQYGPWTTLYSSGCLYEAESDALDFKRDQYSFAKATDEEKSELLKDILGFANAWRRAESYILIGVEDVRGARKNVVGIPPGAHLDDHSLQQFVNSLTNRPVLFHYAAFGFEGKQVGIIRIEEQERPIFLKKDFGKLRANQVYVRRGSSTDPTNPALPDEIARLGARAAPPQAELAVAFAAPGGDASLGTRIAWEAEFCTTPEPDTIPLLQDPPPRDRFGLALPVLPGDPRANAQYYRELAEYESARRLFRPVRLLITAPRRNLWVKQGGSNRASAIGLRVSGVAGGSRRRRT
jgi:hypothetical protein